MRSPYARFAPHAILFVAFVLRIANLTGESLWRDEVDTARFAFEPLGNILANFTATGFNGPLYHLLVRAWLSAGGINDFALRYLSLVCGVALVALVYVLGKRMLGWSAALSAMWLAAIAPILIWYAGEGKMYSLQPMLLALALYALIRVVSPLPAGGTSSKRSGGEEGQGGLLPGWAMKEKTRSALWWLVFILATSFSFYMQLLSPLFLVVAIAFFIALWPRSRHHVVGGIVSLALLTLPYVPLALWQVPAFLQGGDIGHMFYPLNIIASTLASNWTLGLDDRAPLLGMPLMNSLVLLTRLSVLALFVLLMGYGLVDTSGAARRDDCERTRFKLQWATLVWLIAPTLLVFIVSTRLPIFQPRYVLWCAPALYLLTGVGLARLRAHGVTGRAASGLSLAVLTLASLAGGISQIINPIRPDLRGAATYVANTIQPGDVIVFQIPYGRYGFEYYALQAGKPIDASQIVEAPYTNYGMSPDDTAASLVPALESAHRAWLYEIEPEMWDQRRLVRAFFDGVFTPLDRREFRGVSVGVYELRPAGSP